MPWWYGCCNLTTLRFACRRGRSGGRGAVPSKGVSWLQGRVQLWTENDRSPTFWALSNRTSPGTLCQHSGTDPSQDRRLLTGRRDPPAMAPGRARSSGVRSQTAPVDVGRTLAEATSIIRSSSACAASVCATAAGRGARAAGVTILRTLKALTTSEESHSEVTGTCPPSNPIKSHTTPC